MKMIFVIGLLVVFVFLPTLVCLWLLLLTEIPKGPKGEKLTSDVIKAYKEQDDLDKESVFDICEN